MSAGEDQIVAGRFRLGARASEGGMAYIVRAEDLKTGLSVAVKLLKVTDPECLARFEREATVLEALRHPQIVEHVAHGVHADSPFLVLEWLEGCDLRARLERGPLDVDESLAIAEAVSRALRAAHALGVVHRDLKPENAFLVGDDPRAAKLLDFGIARIEGSSRTQTGAMMGTPHYMAPEQARGEPTDARTDLWALGVVLFECLSGGVQPFQGEHIPAILTKVAFEPAPSLADLAPHVPEHLVDLCSDLLEKDPDKRPKSAAEVLDRLASVPPPSLRPSRRQTLGRLERTTACVVLTGIPPAHEGPRRPRHTVRLVPGEGMPVELEHGGYALVLVRDGEAVDIAARAARQALTLRDDLGPSVPIAVVTTRVVSRGHIGGPIEEAARLLASATEGIVLDEATAALLEGRFELTHEGERALLVGERGAAETSRLLLGKATPFVGRDYEIGMVEGLYDETIDDHSSRVVIITAGAGAGKSRLWREVSARLERRAEPPVVWLAKGDPERAGTPFALLAAIVREAIACREDQDRAEQARTLEAFCVNTIGPSEGREQRCLSVLLDLADGDDGQARPSVDEIYEAFIVAARASAGGRALVVALEDVHWADRPSVVALDRMVASDRVQPLLLVTLARPTELESLADVLDRRNPLRISLPPLRPRAIEVLARSTLGEQVPRAALDFIVSHAQGNAFVVEELIRAVSRGENTLPESALAVAEARLDTLAPRVRRVFRAASIFGETVWGSAVASLVAEPDVGGALETLVEQELLLSRSTSRFAGETEYGLRHALLREAGYATLSDDDRVRGHAAAFAWLTLRGEKSAAVLARHAERGGRHPDAVTLYTRAAREALAAFDHVAAGDLVARGLSCGAEGEERASLLWVAAETHVLLQHPGPTREAGAQALACTAPGSVIWYGVAGCLASAAQRLSDASEATRLFLAIDEMARLTAPPAAAAPALLRAARSLLILDLVNESSALAALAAQIAGDTPAVLGPLHQLRALTALTEGRLDLGLAQIEKAIAEHGRAGNVGAVVNAKQDVMLFLTRLGRFDEAEAAYRESLAGRHELSSSKNSLLENLALARVSARRNLAEAADAADRGEAYRVSLGDQRYIVACSLVGARAQILLGHPDRARERLLARQTQAEDQPTMLGLWLATLADAERLSGDSAGAAVHADAAEYELERRRPALELPDVFAWSAITEAFAAAGRADDARRVARRLGERLALQAGRIDDEDDRRRFSEMPDNVEARALVERLS